MSPARGKKRASRSGALRKAGKARGKGRGGASGAAAKRKARARRPVKGRPRRRELELEVLPQPDDTTCGPTCLHAIYRYHGDDLPLDRVIGEIDPLETGGTLAVFLACHALRRGYSATIYTYNLHVFDPTWFTGGVDLRERLEAQAGVKDDPKLRLATRAYLEFLELGGKLRYEELRPRLIRRYLDRDRPILTGLSATYLYGCSREDPRDYNDLEGEPVGHFVVISGYRRRKRKLVVADPLHDNPGFESPYYEVGMDRLIGAILLGIVTYDANLLILDPPRS